VLREKLDNAVVVDAAPANGDVVAFGSKVEVVDESSGRTAEYTLVGSTEADLSAGLLSAESPVARALFGARAGDVVSIPLPRGERKLRISRIGVR
jgi:transcription elongation factor GreA